MIGSDSGLLLLDVEQFIGPAFSSIIRKYHNYIVVLNVPTRGLMFGARKSMETMLTKFGSHIFGIETWDINDEDGSVCLPFYGICMKRLVQ